MSNYTTHQRLWTGKAVLRIVIHLAIYLICSFATFFLILATLAELEIISTGDQWMGIGFLTGSVAPLSFLLFSGVTLAIIFLLKKAPLLRDWLFIITYGISAGVLTFISFGFLTGLGVLQKLAEIMQFTF